MNDTAVPDGIGVSAVAAATGYSVQQIRDLEALGVLAAARRGSNGYRRFSPQHVRDLHTYRDLVDAVGPVAARRTLVDVRALPDDAAAALVCSLHSGLERERARTLAARAALDAIRTEVSTDAPAVAGDDMSVGELSDALGVRASTLRFWESAGLLTPERTTTATGSVRRYPLPVIRDARIVAALRAAGYPIPAVRTIVTDLRELGDLETSRAVLDARIVEIGRRMLALLRAGAVLAAIVAERSGSVAAAGDGWQDTRPHSL
ncbi:MerR family transcriptional regulator [Prescottella sp. R16]|uniref:MerR family transcriptional regulator n=1 Tax=Prescottella sp. R16 TaxID=3064529 RepID=UPI00272EC673|nr:MerR family transcriptional regulator [Prescottella sp. R16]